MVIAKVKSIIEKYRQEAVDSFSGDYIRRPTWRAAFLEAIFRPEMKVGGGRGRMTHLHPDQDKLHLPHNIYLPDWRKYRVEDHPMLVNFQKRCHAAGLHDPWLRNYAHGLYPHRIMTRSVTALVLTQASWGFTAALLIFIGQKVYLHYYPYIYDHTPEYIEKYGTGELH